MWPLGCKGARPSSPKGLLLGEHLASLSTAVQERGTGTQSQVQVCGSNGHPRHFSPLPRLGSTFLEMSTSGMASKASDPKAKRNKQSA